MLIIDGFSFILYFHFSNKEMFFRLILLFLLISIVKSWSIKKPKPNTTCCILAKLHINATRANFGREFFINLIQNNESYKNVNEDNICSLMHFFMQEAVLNGRPIQFRRGLKRIFLFLF
jgi:hypothetical protein